MSNKNIDIKFSLTDYLLSLVKLCGMKVWNAVLMVLVEDYLMMSQQGWLAWWFLDWYTVFRLLAEGIEVVDLRYVLWRCYWGTIINVSVRMVGLEIFGLTYSYCWLRVWRLLTYCGGVIEEPLIMSQQRWLVWWFEIYLLYSDCAGCEYGLCCFGGVGWHILDSGYCWYTAAGGGDGLWGRFIVICYKKKKNNNEWSHAVYKSIDFMSIEVI